MRAHGTSGPCATATGSATEPRPLTEISRFPFATGGRTLRENHRFADPGVLMRRYLVVGNQTLRSARLLRELRARLTDGPCSFYVLVHAANPHVHAFWTEGEAHAVAQDRLDEAVEHLAGEGIPAVGSVGDASPLDAVTDLLLREEFDEVIVSTLPPGPSRWIHHD